jgi:hypothetical protein
MHGFFLSPSSEGLLSWTLNLNLGPTSFKSEFFDLMSTHCY